MDFEKLTIREIRDESRFERHYRLDGASAAFLDAYARPGMRVRVRLGSEAHEVGLASRPKRPPVEVLVERASPLGAALEGKAAGAVLEVSRPFGEGLATAGRHGDRLYVFARGGGLGPARAVVLDAIAGGSQLGEAYSEVTAVLEGTYPSEIAYHDELPAWQRAGVTVVQTLSRPDVGKWKTPAAGAGRGDAEGAYIYDFTLDLIAREGARFDPERVVAFVAGPDDMVQGITGALRALEVPPTRVYVFELAGHRAQHRREPERAAKLLDKITNEGVYGSGHQDDAPDHPPVLRTPERQPVGHAKPRYKTAKRTGGAAGGHGHGAH